MSYTYCKTLVPKDKYDVIVVGGGTAGVTAAIASKRQGARTLLIEKSGALGGMMTLGNCGLTTYVKYASNKENQCKMPLSVQIAGGIPMELTNKLIENKYAVATNKKAGSYVFTSQFKFRKLLNEIMCNENIDILFHTTLVDTVMKEDSIKGVVLHNKEGLTLYEADIFIDCTGDGDVAACSGANFFIGTGPYDIAYEENPSVLGKMGAMGVMFRAANINIQNCLSHLKDKSNKDNAWFEIQIMSLQTYEEVIESLERSDMATFVIKFKDGMGIQIYNTPEEGVFIIGCPCYEGNGLNAKEKSIAELQMTKLIDDFMDKLKTIPGFEQAVVIDVPEVGVRETRHIVGEYILTLKDVLNMKHFDDSIGKGSHLIDISPVPSWLKKDELPELFSFDIPYRTLIVKNVKNLYTAGRCISCTHEASGSMRVTVQCMITGEAVGTAAGLCIENRKSIRELDFKHIKNQLQKNGAVI